MFVKKNALYKRFDNKLTSSVMLVFHLIVLSNYSIILWPNVNRTLWEILEDSWENRMLNNSRSYAVATFCRTMAPLVSRTGDWLSP